jgi:hypothetical protein
MPLFSTLIDKVARDEEYLQQTLEQVGAKTTDCSTLLQRCGRPSCLVVSVGRGRRNAAAASVFLAAGPEAETRCLSQRRGCQTDRSAAVAMQSRELSNHAHAVPCNPGPG